MWTLNDIIILPITFLIMLGIVLVTKFLLKNRSDKIKRIPFIIITSVFLILEVIKQIIWIWEPGGNYNLFWIPLHICSIFIYATPLALFTKQNSKVSNTFWALSLIGALMVTVGLYIVPEVIMSACNTIFTPQANFLTYQTFIYHNLIVMFLMFWIALNPFQPSKKDLIKASVIFSAFMAFCAVMAHALQTDFMRYLNFPISLIDIVLEKAGYFLYDFLIWGMCTIAVFGSSLVIFYYLKIKERYKNKKQLTQSNSD